MLGVDTNILVRFLVRDDEAQYEKARKLIKREVAAGHRVFVSQLVLLETEWVLRSRYRLPKNLIIETISGLLDTTDVRFEDDGSVQPSAMTVCSGFSTTSFHFAYSVITLFEGTETVK